MRSMPATRPPCCTRRAEPPCYQLMQARAPTLCSLHWGGMTRVHEGRNDYHDWQKRKKSDSSFYNSSLCWRFIIVVFCHYIMSQLWQRQNNHMLYYVWISNLEVSHHVYLCSNLFLFWDRHAASGFCLDCHILTRANRSQFSVFCLE